jgi:hypothetical protein
MYKQLDDHIGWGGKFYTTVTVTWDKRDGPGKYYWWRGLSTVNILVTQISSFLY